MEDEDMKLLWDYTNVIISTWVSLSTISVFSFLFFSFFLSFLLSFFLQIEMV